MKKLWGFLIPVLLVAKGSAESWDLPRLWETSTDGRSAISVKAVPGLSGQGLELAYNLEGNGWVQMRKKVRGMQLTVPLVFQLKADSPSTFEIKFVDSDGSNFLKKISLKNKFQDWSPFVIYARDLDYGWGGDDQLRNVQEIYFAVSGSGSGTVWLDEIALGKEGLASTFDPNEFLDPDRETPGIGFKQRRSRSLIPEDPLVYEWVKLMQDSASPDQALVPSMEDNLAQTFNNALAAMVFILKGDRERAERILNFYAKATHPSNQDPTLQNFFYKGEARGFFQTIVIRGNGVSAYHAVSNSDRWVGDMAWLVIVCKYYEKIYGSSKYKNLENLIINLLKSFYKDDLVGGYVQNGWRNGDTELHGTEGYGEPNIDCYVAFSLCGEKTVARKIKRWLDHKLKGKNLPLDNYSWRVLAFGRNNKDALNIPEYDFRFRKTLIVNGEKVAGFFHGPDDVQNFWLDGTGHMACAFYSVSEVERGNFYANQLDPFLIHRKINGQSAKSLPYTANKQGGYEWVDLNKGFVATACWYILAKNRFNPLDPLD